MSKLCYFCNVCNLLFMFTKYSANDIRIYAKFSMCHCCTSLGVPVDRGEAGHGYCHLFFVFSFLSSRFSHYVLYQQSPTPSIFSCCSPFSSLSFQISLNVRLSQRFRKCVRSLASNKYCRRWVDTCVDVIRYKRPYTAVNLTHVFPITTQKYTS